jgi:hypothetical protein
MLVAVAAEPESATEASDAELAGRVRGGDRAAEAELFRRLAPRVRLYGLRHLRDPAAEHARAHPRREVHPAGLRGRNDGSARHQRRDQEPSAP